MNPRPTVAELLPRLNPAQVLLVRRKGWLAWLIRRVTKPPGGYSHATLVDRTESGVAITVEAADQQGVKALRLEAYLENPGVTGLLLRDSTVLTPWERHAIMQAAWLRVGAKYDTLALVGIYVRRRLPWLFGNQPLAQNRLDSKDRYFCSELVSVAYAEGAGVNLLPEGVALGTVDPGHLAQTPKLFTVWEWDAGT